MNDSQISPVVSELAPVILAEIKKAKSILLHCHPSPDPDSVGSTLAMKFALESLGKKATIIKGDTEIPDAFMHFPGANTIVAKNFFEIDYQDYDLFLILDSGSKEMISRYKPITLPLPIRSIVIDHHASNKGYGDINLVASDYPAVCQILFDLFTLWDVEITPDIAGNLFMGIYTDTGGFKYENTTTRTFRVASELAHIIPQFPKIIADMENTRKPSELAFQAMALDSVETFLNGNLALSVITLDKLKERNISLSDVHGENISPILKSVAGWHITGVMVEVLPNVVKMSFRCKDSKLYDVSKLAGSLGGGGHKAAAGATLQMSVSDAKNAVIEKARELYHFQL